MFNTFQIGCGICISSIVPVYNKSICKYCIQYIYSVRKYIRGVCVYVLCHAFILFYIVIICLSYLYIKYVYHLQVITYQYILVDMNTDIHIMWFFYIRSIGVTCLVSRSSVMNQTTLRAQMVYILKSSSGRASLVN